MRAVAEAILIFLAVDLAAFGLLLAAVWAAYRRAPADDTPRDAASFVAVGLGWALAAAVVAVALWWIHAPP